MVNTPKDPRDLGIEEMVRQELSSKAQLEQDQFDQSYGDIVMKVRKRLTRLAETPIPKDTPVLDLQKLVEIEVQTEMERLRIKLRGIEKKDEYSEYRIFMKLNGVTPVSKKTFFTKRENNPPINNFNFVRKHKIKVGTRVRHRVSEEEFEVMGFTPFCLIKLKNIKTGENNTPLNIGVYEIIPEASD